MVVHDVVLIAHDLVHDDVGYDTVNLTRKRKSLVETTRRVESTRLALTRWMEPTRWLDPSTEPTRWLVPTLKSELVHRVVTWLVSR